MFLLLLEAVAVAEAGVAVAQERRADLPGVNPGMDTVEEEAGPATEARELFLAPPKLRLRPACEESCDCN